jgi:hypothetical protein
MDFDFLEWVLFKSEEGLYLEKVKDEGLYSQEFF